MPNWNQNKLTITQMTDELREWLSADGGLSFERIKPTPTEMLNDESHSWYDWRVENWGTKWDLIMPERGRAAADELLTCGETFFDTAWAPPIPVIADLSRLFPEAGFRLDYYESGFFFAGCCVFDGGSYFDDQLEDDDEIKAFARSVFDEEFDEESTNH